MKKLLLLFLFLAVGAGLFFAAYQLDNDNADVQELKELVAPLENELVSLQHQLGVSENKIDESYEIASVLIAFYAPDSDKLPKADGYYPILISKTPVDADGDSASWNGAWDTDCCYLDIAIDTLPNREELMDKGVNTFLRNAQLVSAGFDGKTYTLPYVVLNSNGFNMPDQLDLLKQVPGTLVFVFDMNTLTLPQAEGCLRLLKEAADAGILRFSRLEDEKAFLYSAHLAEEVRRAEFEEHRTELEARIEALQQQIHEISRDWNEKHGLKK